jgi:hypothetical protein
LSSGPPYSVDFVAHLHGGCYPDAVTDGLLTAVRRDPDAARVLDSLTITQVELHELGLGEHGSMTH